MVIYTCDRCKKNFNKKYDYDNHVDKKIPCIINSKINKNIKKLFFCDICNKHFNRSDVLKKHLKTLTHNNNKIRLNYKINKNIINKNIINGNKNDITNFNNNGSGNINGNNNNVTINKNYYFISPFGQEEINKLTIAEKLSTLLSPENPIVKIVLVTNLDPNKPEYHNVGYTDLKSGYGIIFNGKSWEKKDIGATINELVRSKKNDLFKLYLELDPYLSEADSKIIKEKLQRVENIVEPKIHFHVQSNKKMLKNLKTHFYNNRDLVYDAIDKSGASIIGSQNHNAEPWLDKYDLDDIDKKINQRKLETEKISIKKELALYVLDKINNINHEILRDIIKETMDINVINVINRLLTKSYCLNENLDESIIKKQIKKDVLINEILSNN